MKHSCGILLPVFSLPSMGGIGDFGPSAYRFADDLAAHGIAHWQILPLNAGNPLNGESPYFSASAFAINPLLISLETLKTAGLLTVTDLKTLPDFPADCIAYDKVRSAKMPLLEKAASRFKESSTFNHFCQANRHWLDDFALFDVLRFELADQWIKWPLALRDRDPQALAEISSSRQVELRQRKVIQFLAWSQWQDLHAHCRRQQLTLIGDMPIYVALDSADTWSHPGLFKLDEQKRPLKVSGVPPDYFSATGQLWNNPVYNWENHQTDNFSWWIERMRQMFSLYDIVRIDHFRGLIQYWEIPAGETTAIHGTWRDVPTHIFLDTLMDAIKPFPVVCEDLGIITEDVRIVMEHYRFPGMKILQFAFGDDDPKNPYLPENYNNNCLVYTGTHDNLPTLGWLKTETDQKVHKRIVQHTGKNSSCRNMVWDLIELAMKSPATIAVLPLQDILTLDETSRINDPASMDGNWRWRWDENCFPAKIALDQLVQLGRKHRRMRI